MTNESENTEPESSDKELSDAVNEALAEVEVDEVAVLTSDLQRVQAEYSNYRKRVDRDRITANEITTAIVLSELLPVLDDISRAEEHGELSGGFKAVADQMIAITTKLGLSQFAEVNVAFNPKYPRSTYACDISRCNRNPSHSSFTTRI